MAVIGETGPLKMRIPRDADMNKKRGMKKRETAPLV